MLKIFITAIVNNSTDCNTDFFLSLPFGLFNLLNPSLSMTAVGLLFISIFLNIFRFEEARNQGFEVESLESLASLFFCFLFWIKMPEKKIGEYWAISLHFDIRQLPC